MPSQPPKPELIVMLTYQDRTVPDALDLFQRTREYPIAHWGFKDVGLSAEEMKIIVEAMKDAGKTTFLEVVSLSEQEGLGGAQLAVELGFDILMGTVYFPSISEYLRDKPVRYYPFPGHVHSHPSILDGTIDEIVAHARQLEAHGAHGLDLPQRRDHRLRRRAQRRAGPAAVAALHRPAAAHRRRPGRPGRPGAAKPAAGRAARLRVLRRPAVSCRCQRRVPADPRRDRAAAAPPGGGGTAG